MPQLAPESRINRLSADLHQRPFVHCRSSISLVISHESSLTIERSTTFELSGVTPLLTRRPVIDDE
jgi:hypothetical protein